MVPVLIYHEIGHPTKPAGETVISIERFSEQMQYLADNGYEPISIDRLVRFMRDGGSLPERPVVLTFDDGWRNVLNALPILDRHGFKASFWIIAGKGIGNDYLDWPDIRRIAGNPRYEVQSHTLTHPWNPSSNLITWLDGKVAGKNIEDVRAELRESKHILEQQLQRPVRYLAWPVGWYNATLIDLAKEAGYEALLTADDGTNGYRDDIFHIKRVFVDGACDMNAFVRALKHARYVACQTARGTERVNES
jgi:peptidoglycan/xylan/chitin deacetylase (PgdA/CDA1 family)